MCIPTLAFLVHLLAWISLLSAPVIWAQGPPSQPNPDHKIQLIIHSAPSTKDQAERAMVRCLNQDVLMTWGLQGKVIAGPSEGTHTAALVDPEGCPSQEPHAWRLLDARGRTVASGPGLPTAEGLQETLLRNGFTSSIVELRNFLIRHPEHGEARLDLVAELARCAAHRWGRAQRGNSGELTEEEDLLIWGDLPIQLGSLLAVPEASAGWIDLPSLLPKAQALQNSPRMRSALKMHHSGLTEALQRDPSASLLWRNVMFLDQVLGRHSTLDLLGGLAWPPLPPQGFPRFPFMELARQLAVAAEATQHWEEASRGFAFLWEHGAKIKLRYYGKDVIAAGRPGSTASEVREAGRSERLECWDRLLVPWVESLCRSGRPSAVLTLLAELDSTWSDLDLPKRVDRLGGSLGYPGEAKTWARILQHLPDPPPGGRPLGPEFVLFYQAQPLGGPGPFWELDLQRAGLSILCMEPPTTWKRHLGWPDGLPKWAIVGGDGRILDQGEAWPPGEDLIEQMHAQSQFRLGGPLDRFIQGHNEHAPARALSLIHLGGHLSTPPPQSTKSAHDLERKNPATENIFSSSWPVYANGLLRFFKTSNWRDRVLLAQVIQSFPPVTVIPEGYRPEAQALATQILPELEKALERWPTDTTLWMAWSRLADTADIAPLSLLSGLEASPIRPRGHWPPYTVLLKGLQSCEKSGKWMEVREVLGPFIEGRLKSRNLRPEASSFLWGEGDREAVQRLFERANGMEGTGSILSEDLRRPAEP